MDYPSTGKIGASIHVIQLQFSFTIRIDKGLFSKDWLLDAGSLDSWSSCWRGRHTVAATASSQADGVYSYVVAQARLSCESKITLVRFPKFTGYP